MSDLAAFVEMRKHPRAQVRLPARIRWRGPLGMRFEKAYTIDVSREGFLIHRAEHCEAWRRAWVTFPFDAGAATPVQPETPVRILRVEEDPRGGFRVALRLEGAARAAQRPAEHERRASPRIPFALPIFVRAVGSPFPEESMTQDLSRGGARFETAHVYICGDAVLATIPWEGWANAGEMPARIIRIDPSESSGIQSAIAASWTTVGTNLASVAVEWEKPQKS
ncbi:MAG: PilZ domain-containing protein [Candidatus Acidiferrales bacterium]